LKELKKDTDPMIVNEWIPTGPIISCIGCGKTFNDNRGKSGLRKGADVKKLIKINKKSIGRSKRSLRFLQI